MVELVPVEPSSPLLLLLKTATDPTDERKELFKNPQATNEPANGPEARYPRLPPETSTGDS